jgi:hypothetical protein
MFYISKYLNFLLILFIQNYFLIIIQFINAQQQQQPFQSNECKKSLINCENSTDCVHRLAVLQSTWFYFFLF